MKRPIMLAIAALALILAMPAAAFAADDAHAGALVPGGAASSEEAAFTGSVVLNLIQSGAYQAPETGAKGLATQATDLTDEQYAGLAASLDEALPKLQESISIIGLKIEAEVEGGTITNGSVIGASVSKYVNAHPDLFFVNNSLQFDAKQVGSKVYFNAIKPGYSYSASNVSSMKTKYESAISSITAAIPSGATDVQRAKFVHDWLVCRNLYNDDAASLDPATASDKTPWNAYSGLVAHNPVCEGFSLAYIAVMNRLGISCTYVAQDGVGSGHGWNRIELGGKWYNVDVTWDESMTNKKASTAAPDATYFLKSDAWFRAHPDKDGFHKTWSPAGTAGTDTTYDGYTTSSWPAYFKLAAKPKGKTLTYNGAAQAGVASLAGYALSGTPKATAAGSYTATAKLNANYVWSDATDGAATVRWKIAPASLSRVTVSGISNKTFTGKAATQAKLALAYNGAKLVLARDFTVKYANATKPGTATITITGKGNYTGTVKRTFSIAKAANPMKVKAKSKTIKVKFSKKKARTVTAAKAFSFTKKAQGKVTYKKASGNKKITVSKSGKITVKKGLERGTYKVSVNVKAAGNANYKAKTTKVTLKVKVK